MGGLSIGRGVGYSLPSPSTGGRSGGGGGFDEVDEHDVVADGQTFFATTATMDPTKSKHMVVLNGRVMRRGVDYDVVSGGVSFKYGINAGSCVVVYYVVLD
jgi:hypothetical protein